MKFWRIKKVTLNDGSVNFYVQQSELDGGMWFSELHNIDGVWTEFETDELDKAVSFIRQCRKEYRKEHATQQESVEFLTTTGKHIGFGKANNA